MRIAILSDIHSCAETYAQALSAARASGVDALLIIGDLLTYGVEPQRVIDLTAEAVQRDGAVLVLGNHDQIYIDHHKGGSPYEQALPSWIRESVDWTREQIGGLDFGDAFDWKRKWSSGEIYVAHANPFAYGDWTYLSTFSAMQAAAEHLDKMGFSAGFFGHSHRYQTFEAAPLGVKLVTVGSLGQPRDRQDMTASWSLISAEGDGFNVSQQQVIADWTAHVRAIQATSLSETTKANLCGFFQKS